VGYFELTEPAIHALPCDLVKLLIEAESNNAA
jgi:hypothetical protein